MEGLLPKAKSLLIFPVSFIVCFLISKHPQVRRSIICFISVLMMNYTPFTKAMSKELFYNCYVAWLTRITGFYISLLIFIQGWSSHSCLLTCILLFILYHTLSELMGFVGGTHPVCLPLSIIICPCPSPLPKILINSHKRTKLKS